MMTTEVAKLGEHLTVQASRSTSSAGRPSMLETIYYLYVVDEEDHLRGVVSTRQLVTAIGKPLKSSAS